MQNGAADAAHIRLTHFQFGMLCNAAAEALLAMGFASLPGEVVNLVVRLEVPPYTVVDAGMPEASKAPSSVQKQPPPFFLTRSRPSSGVCRHSRTARSSSGSSAVVSSLHDFDVSTFVPSPPLHVKSGSRSACASSAWLAPDSTIEVGDGGYAKAHGDMEIAPPPDGLHTLRCR